MALVPNWVDLPNQVFASQDDNHCEAICKDGNILWAVFGHPYPASGPWQLHKSLDSGVTWTYVNLIGITGSTSYSPIFDSTNANARQLIKHQNKLFYFSANGSSYVHWSSLDLADIGSGWTAWDYFTNHDSNLWYDGTMSACSRGNDIILMDSSTAASYPFPPKIRIKKYNGTSWSDLGTIGGAGTFAILGYAMVDPSNNVVHIFSHQCDSDSGTGQIPDFCHNAIDPDDDSITTTHVIQSAVDSQYNFGFPCVGFGAINGTTIAAPYGEDVGYGNWDLYPNPTYGIVKVAFGDMSGDPLNPSWTVTTGPSEASLSFSEFNVQIQVAYEGSVPWVYYTSAYPETYPRSPDYPPMRLRRSSYVSGSWTGSELWYDPLTDTTLDPVRDEWGWPLANVANFQLVRGFTSSYGILVDVEEIYAGYAGPALGRNNYVSAGGPLASRGNHASA